MWIGFYNQFFIILYKPIHTSSFNTPTLNKIEYNFGFSLSFIKFNDTIVLVDAITNDNNKMVFKSNLNFPTKFKFLEWFINIAIVTNVIKVPKIPW